MLALGSILAERKRMLPFRSSRKIRSPALPLLRAPPFPGATVSQSADLPLTPAPCLTDEVIDELFTAIRNARIGGRFWEKHAGSIDRRLIVRVRSAIELTTVQAGLNEVDRTEALWILPLAMKGATSLCALISAGSVIFGEVDPWSLIDEKTRLLTHGDDEWVALTHIAGGEVQLLSAGLYGAADAGAAEIRQRIADTLFYAHYRDPHTGHKANIYAVIAYLGLWRRIAEANRDIVSACGIAWWKRREVSRFLWSPDRPLRFFRSERRALAHSARHLGAVAIWPSRISATMVQTAKTLGVPLIRIEDGFVRSIGLGSDMVPPSSVTVDRLGIHYDPSRASDLEVLLATTRFSPGLLERADALRADIVAGGISKYGGSNAHAFPERHAGRRLVLVPGQVEDDMSVLLGGGGLTSSLELLRRARALEPDAEIWFRPHPDVDAGHRKGAVRDTDALAYANRIVRGGGMAGLLDLVDAVHVLTSLTGFEALLRGRDVTCHGTPFYAGWGLTRDLMPVPERRERPLTLDQLVAGVLILYPRYLDPVTALPCEPEVLLGRMVSGDAVNRLGWVSGIRRLQGRLSRRRR
jgi:capsular polysaccharide export protein